LTSVASPVVGRAAGIAALALVLNALVWGTSWWPFRWLQAAGLHPLWATALIYTLASALIVAARPRALGQVLRTPALWVLVAAAGTTNASFNWGVVIGDVVRVVLLFYLMPLWTVLLARGLLGERFTAAAALRTVLALAGAAIVLWPENPAGDGAATALAAHLPLPRSLADWLGVVGGFSFALNNVMLRREADRPEEGRALAMFLGGAVVAGALAGALATSGQLDWPAPAHAAGWLAPVGLMTALFLAGNLALQYGAARLAANRTSVVMLTEVVFASASAIAFGGGTLTARVALGGGLIVASALLAALAPADRH
jgi:drug/metabolite transporter (DMT)-like permease